MEIGETLEECVIRETREETGLDIERIKTVQRRELRRHGSLADQGRPYHVR